MVQRIEQDRRRYLAPDEEFGDLPSEHVERSALIRRIHHQRIELRQLQQVMISVLQWRATERRRWDDWWKREHGWSDESDESCTDVGKLRARLRTQRRSLRYAHRLIDQQQKELGAMLQRSIVRAATG